MVGEQIKIVWERNLFPNWVIRDLRSYSVRTNEIITPFGNCSFGSSASANASASASARQAGQ